MQDTTLIKFIKLKNGDDLVGFILQETESDIYILRPLAISIETDLEEVKQFIGIREWLPPSIVKEEGARLPRTDILLIMEVENSFKEDFVQMSKLLYSIKKIEQEPFIDTETPKINGWQ
jgi:hypothetical protein